MRAATNRRLSGPISRGRAVSAPAQLGMFDAVETRLDQFFLQLAQRILDRITAHQSCYRFAHQARQCRSWARCCSGDRSALRLRHGETVVSRTMATPIMRSTWGSVRSRSRAMRRMTASCCQSFSPNSALSGRTWLNSLRAARLPPRRMARPVAAAQAFADRPQPRYWSHSLRDRLLRVAGPQLATPSFFEQRRIARHLSQVSIQILVLAELAWVDEDRHCDVFGVFARFPYQVRNWPSVRRPPCGRDQRQRALAAERVGGAAEVIEPGYSLQCSSQKRRGAERACRSAPAVEPYVSACFGHRRSSIFGQAAELGHQVAMRVEISEHDDLADGDVLVAAETAGSAAAPPNSPPPAAQPRSFLRK